MADWSSFKALFVSADGRVLDNGNRGVSHTESQGLGMLFAASFDDRETFERIYAWTHTILRRPDGLHSWRYVAGQIAPVSDPNNATDGDIYIAAALQQAALRWSSAAYFQEARIICESILERCTISINGKSFLLPAADGFVKSGYVVVNPSYYVFPLFRFLNMAFPSPTWAQIEESGLALIADAKFGKWSLPADWLQIRKVDGAVSMAESFPARFSYDAVRIPLFLAWAGVLVETTRAISRFWSIGCAAEPSIADLKTGAVVGRFTLLGAKSIATLIASSGTDLGNISFGQIGPAETYYSCALHLLTRIAAEEIGQRS